MFGIYLSNPLLGDEGARSPSGRVVFVCHAHHKHSGCYAATRLEKAESGG